jgi:Na+-translocating ferredoxin:NAD+ oxidoreductase subunit G
MKDIIRFGSILAGICIVAGGLLAIMHLLTYPRIIALEKAREAASLREVMPGADHFEAVKFREEEVIYYKAYDKAGNLTGVAFKASGKGYSGIVETMAGMNLDGTITAIKILTQGETPGMGTRITEPSFLGQFTQRNMQDLAGVQAITGATISSRAVIEAVKNKAQEIKSLYGK